MTAPDPAEDLLGYIDDAHLDPGYVVLLIDQIIHRASERARDRLVKAVWAERTLSEDSRYSNGWTDGTDAAVDTIKTAYLGTCSVCRAPIDYIESPTATWWAHRDHPGDNHDATPVR